MPLLLVHSTYDQWAIKHIITAKCLSRKEPYSLRDCDDYNRSLIEQYRKLTVNAFYEMKA